MAAELREDADDYQEGIGTAISGAISQIQTGMPGIIVSFNGVTAVVQPAIQTLRADTSGNKTPGSIAPIPDVPVQFPSGGGMVLTFPVAPGDECWLSFSSRCIDNWFATGTVNPPPHPRLYDISDAVAHLGFRSKPNAIANVSKTSTQLRSSDGTTFIEVKNGQLVNIVAPGGLTITAPTVNISGALNVQSEITAKSGSGASVSLSGHHGHVATSNIPPTAGT